jgi:hypothetical protein
MPRSDFCSSGVTNDIIRESSKFPFSLARARRDCPKTSEIGVVLSSWPRASSYNQLRL